MYSQALDRLDRLGPLYQQILVVAGVSLFFAVLLIFSTLGIAYAISPEFVSQVNSVEEFDDVSWVVAIFLAPPIETLLFQTWLLLAIKKLTDAVGNQDTWFPAFLVTSIVFAAAHGVGQNSIFLGLFNTLTRVPLSFALALLAISQRSKNEYGRPFMAVTFAHGLYNLLIFAIIAALNLAAISAE